MKEIFKDKLFGENQLLQARQECSIASKLEHKNVVKLESYTEDEEKITMIMEYCTHGD